MDTTTSTGRKKVKSAFMHFDREEAQFFALTLMTSMAKGRAGPAGIAKKRVSQFCREGTTVYMDPYAVY